MSAFSLRTLSPTLFGIVEDDKWRENPIMYLIVAEDKLVLIDTGCGTGDLLNFIRSDVFAEAGVPECLKSKILVINTHNHFDHVAGNHIFSPESAEKSPYCLDLCAGGRDKQYTSHPRNNIGWRLGEGERIYLSEDGSNFLTVIHVPGHSPDSIALYYPKEARIFVGDFIYQWAPILAIGVKSDVGDFVKSADKLESFAKNVEERDGKKLLLCCGHINDSLESSYLAKFREFLMQIRDSEISGVMGHMGMQYENEDRTLSFVHGVTK